MLYLDNEIEDYVSELYELLAERPEEANISHKKMPTWDEHKHFVNVTSHNLYQDWIILKNEDQEVVGSVYLTMNREVGIAIFKKHQGKGYGKEAIEAIRAKYPGPLYANIAPKNEASRAFFLSMGFELIQHTYKLGE